MTVYVSTAASTAPVSTMASAMLFGTVLFVTVALTAKTVRLSDTRTLQAAQNPRSQALDVNSLTSIYSLLFHTSVLGMILFYAYLCEYHPPYHHANKSYDRDEFFFLTFLLIVVAWFTWKSNERNKAHDNNKNNSSSLMTRVLSGQIFTSLSTTEQPVAAATDETEVLNRDQTEEWKGWMQFMFLLYHYYHAEEVYNSIRIMITCYVWMTGFGNFSFFYIKGDYSAVRVLQMLWRLNFLVLFLCLSQGTTYILYYICLLHTYYFCMVYVTMRIAKDVNYTKWGIRIKMGILAVLIYLVWDVDSGLFRFFHYPFLGEKPMLGATSGAMWEWYFRSSLDHWSTYLGMTFALNFPITSLFLRKLESKPWMTHFIAKGVMFIAFFVAMYLWVTGPFMFGKFDYNKTNAYYGVIPVVAYIFFRNMSPWLRSNSMDLLHQIGKTTLETYLMQHHVWLTSDAKSLLTLIPGWPKVNFLVVTCIYVLFSRRLYQLTLYLRGMVLPNDRNVCVRNLAALFAVIAFYSTLAFVLAPMGMLNLTTVALVSALSGTLLYNFIVARTWSSFANSSSSSESSDMMSNNSMKGLVFSGDRLYLLCGLGALLVVGHVWNHMATIGATKIKPLPATCAAHLEEGSWVPIDVCNEDVRGQVFRENDVSSIATCPDQTPSYAWGWKATDSAAHCRFVQRDPKALTSKLLKDRHVVFAGDSSIRHLYHATCRQMGDKTAGAYNTTLGKWLDFSKKYKSSQLDFKWAPYVQNITDIAQSIMSETPSPDAIVVGGGAWDRLHMYNTEAEQTNLVSHLSALSKQLQSLKDSNVPVVWVTPTTINNWALATVEKQQNIRETQIAAMRSLYEKEGVNDAASLVLQGPSFTADRVSESYDGVHYPLTVYDAGAQMLLNSFDWVLMEKERANDFTPPRPGSMANPYLGFLILGFTLLTVFLFDGFMGVSYLAAIFAPDMAPIRLYEEAFHILHTNKGLPAIETTSSSSSSSKSSGTNRTFVARTTSTDSNGMFSKRKDSSKLAEPDVEEEVGNGEREAFLANGTSH